MAGGGGYGGGGWNPQGPGDPYGQPFGGPPAGPPNPYGPPGNYGPHGFGPMHYAPPVAPLELQSKVDLWFTLSIVSIFCGCGVLAIIPILFASDAKSAMLRGDFVTAESKVTTSKTLVIIGICCWTAMIALYLLFFVFALALG